MVHIEQSRPNRNCFVAVRNRCEGRTAMFGMGHSRMRVWLADTQPELRQSLLELSRQPPARGEATDEKCGLLPDHQERSLERERERERERAGCTNRTTGKASAEVVLDRRHDGSDGGFEEPSNLRAVRENV